MSIKVIVVGAAGRMGQATVRALTPAEGFEIVAVTGKSSDGQALRNLVPEAPDLEIEEKLGAAIERTQPDVVVSFAHYSAAAVQADQCVKHGVSFVFGMTGISEQDVRTIRMSCKDASVPGMIVPNFAIGAVLLMKFAETAAKWLPDCEIIEMHHDRKEDAPSGTAMLTAQRIGAARTCEPVRLPRTTFKAEGVRGGSVHGVPVHSVRLPGLLAHQEVMFGAPGEILTLRHDSLDRTGFMSGVKLCIRRVRELEGLTIGLDKLLFDSTQSS